METQREVFYQKKQKKPSTITRFNGSCDCAQNEPIAFKLIFKSNYRDDSDEPRIKISCFCNCSWLHLTSEAVVHKQLTKHVMDLSVESYRSGEFSTTLEVLWNTVKTFITGRLSKTDEKSGMLAKRSVGTCMWRLDDLSLRKQKTSKANLITQTM